MTNNNSGYNALCKSVEQSVDLAEAIIEYNPSKESLKVGMDGYSVKFELESEGENSSVEEINYTSEVLETDLNGEAPEETWWRELEPEIPMKGPVAAD